MAKLCSILILLTVRLVNIEVLMDYTKEAFNDDSQVRLKEFCDKVVSEDIALC